MHYPHVSQAQEAVGAGGREKFKSEITSHRPSMRRWATRQLGPSMHWAFVISCDDWEGRAVMGLAVTARTHRPKIY